MVYSRQGKWVEQILQEMAPDLFDKCRVTEGPRTTHIDVEYGSAKISIFFEDGEESARRQLQDFIAAIKGVNKT